MRIVLGLEYDGSSFIGWQSQAATQPEFPKDVQGIQTALEFALGLVANHKVDVMAAGRTDAGVHATMQVLHFDTDVRRTERGWVMGANTNLPDSVSVLWAREFSDDFHARYSALSRSYRYVILNRMSRPCLLRQRVCWIREPLDEMRMHRAAQALVGEHDFSAYRAAQCQSPTPMRNVHSVRVTRVHDYVVIDITANAFLHHMVRNIAGVLIAVGMGKATEGWPVEVLHARDRKQGGVTASASGLYLFGVTYPERFDLPSQPSVSAWPPGPPLA
jgi:tRNA pseudouridine38-40 synthase